MEDSFMTKKQKIVAVVSSCTAVIVIAGCLLGAVRMGGGGGAPGGAGGAGDEGTPSQTTVEVAAPTTGSIHVTGEYIGTVEPDQQVIVHPKVSGEVLSVNYAVGETVEKGAVLFSIDSSALESTIAQTKATLSISEAKAALNVESAEDALRHSEEDFETYRGNLDEGLNSTLLAKEAAVESAKNKLQTANNNLRAARRTYRDAVDGESSTDYDDDGIQALRDSVSSLEYSVESAQLGLEEAEAALEATKQQIVEQITSNERTVTSAERGVATAEINADLSDQYIALEKLEDDLGDYNVKAPISGIIEQRNVEAYDMASSATEAYVISNKELMTVSFSVTETSLATMQVGDTVTVEKSGETCVGTIIEISTMVDSANGLFTVKASVDNAPFTLYSGTKVMIIADTEKAENIMTVPIDAVYYDNGMPYVYVYRDGTANKVMVETGISDDNDIEITSGLSMSDEVIVTWSSNLVDGAEVVLKGAAAVDTENSGNGEGVSE